MAASPASRTYRLNQKPRSKNTATPTAVFRIIADELLDQLLAGRDASTVFDKDGLLDDLKRALAERALNSEMDHHLASEGAEGRSNSRNGYGKKTVLTDSGKLGISVPRDRLSTFDPQLIAKYRRRSPGFDEKIISMYARGMTVREIRGHLDDLYGIDVSPDLISAVTDDILDEVAEWQNRPLEALYPLVFFDALRVKVRDEGTVRNKAVYVALGVRLDGQKEILGLWIEQTPSAACWRRSLRDPDEGSPDPSWGQILAPGDDRDQEPGCRGHPHRCRGRLEGISRRHHRCVPRGPGSDLHRPSDPQLSGFRQLQGSQGRRHGPQRGLQGQGCR